MNLASLVLLFFPCVAPAQDPLPGAVATAHGFVENRGQYPEAARFWTHAGGLDAFFTAQGFVLRAAAADQRAAEEAVLQRRDSNAPAKPPAFRSRQIVPPKSHAVAAYEEGFPAKASETPRFCLKERVLTHCRDEHEEPVEAKTGNVRSPRPPSP